MNFKYLILFLICSFIFTEEITPEQLEKITNRWVPYRSVGSWFMWQVANAQPSIPGKSKRVG